MHTQLSITDSMDTVKISQRFACANEQSKWPFCEIEVGLCAWLGVRCAGPHPPPLSLEFHKRSAIFLRLPDFQCFNPGVRLPYERGGNTEIGSTAHFVYNNIATSHLCLQSLCLPCSRKILQYFEPPNRWLASGLLQRMKQNINYPRGGRGGLVLPLRSYTGKLHPKGVPFSSFRYNECRSGSRINTDLFPLGNFLEFWLPKVPFPGFLSNSDKIFTDCPHHFPDFILKSFFLNQKYICYTKNLTDFRKTVETGVDPRLFGYK